jgi:hypothetical protein
MGYHPAIHKRKPVRLKGYDYSQAGYILLPFAYKTGNCCPGKLKATLRARGIIALKERNISAMGVAHRNWQNVELLP